MGFFDKKSNIYMYAKEKKVVEKEKEGEKKEKSWSRRNGNVA